MHSHHHTEASAPIPPSLTGRIARSLGIGETTLNEVDFDDLYVSENVAKTLTQIASALAGSANGEESSSRIKAFWVQESMDLVLCADSGQELHLVRVPENHWTLKPHTYH